METRWRQPVYGPTAFPVVPTVPPRLAEGPKTATMDVDVDMDMVRTDTERSQRAESVLSGMSAEDMEAAETLNSLSSRTFTSISIHMRPRLIYRTEFHAPPQAQPIPTHIHTTTTYGTNDDGQPEPLLTLLTSQHPLAATLINGSLSVYKTTQSYIPLGEWTERNLGLPIAGTIGRVTGVEGGLRRVLQARRDGLQHGQESSTVLQTPDVERGYQEVMPVPQHRRPSTLSTESLPAYNDGDRSPPYSEQQLVLQPREGHPPGWRQQLVISTSGLGVAMSEESIKSLKYCLAWLRWANERLGGALQSLKDLLARWEEDSVHRDQRDMSVSTLVEGQEASRHLALSQQIARVKADVLQTLKQVVGVVSNYAGGALPNNARDLVHRHLTSLPQRFNLASARVHSGDNSNEAASSAHRVMVLAQEGLAMMTQVSGVVNDTLVSAESWCEKLGRRRLPNQQQVITNGEKLNEDDHDASRTHGRDPNSDVKILM